MTTAGHREQAEREVLGSLLLTPRAYEDLPVGFDDEAFELPEYRDLYSKLRTEFVLSGIPVNSVELARKYPALSKLMSEVTWGLMPLDGRLHGRASWLMMHRAPPEIQCNEGVELVVATDVDGDSTEIPPALSDTGNAERFATLNGENVRFDHTQGRWVIWDGRCWQPDQEQRVVEFAKQTVRGMYTEASLRASERQREALVRHALKSESAKSIEHMLRLARSIPAIATTNEVWDRDPLLFNCLNGTYDLGGGLFKPHSRGDLLTKECGVEYRDGSMAPGWLRFLDTIFCGNDRLISFMQRAVGYSLSGDTSEQCLFFCYGSGKNGKTVFTETLRMLFGAYAQKAPAEMLMLKQNDSISNDVARLAGCRFVFCSELQEGRRMHESKVKDLTGGDMIVARLLYKEWFEFRPTHKLWLAGNHKPRIVGTDEGIWRRMYVIPFKATISESDRRPMAELLDEYRAELPGILNWALEGYRRYGEAKGLKPSPEVLAASAEYRNEMDILSNFLGECCAFQTGLKVLNTILYRSYVTWCGENQELPLSNRGFVARLTERGLKLERGAGNARLWRGIGLLTPATASS